MQHVANTLHFIESFKTKCSKSQPYKIAIFIKTYSQCIKFTSCHMFLRRLQCFSDLYNKHYITVLVASPSFRASFMIGSPLVMSSGVALKSIRLRRPVSSGKPQSHMSLNNFTFSSSKVKICSSLLCSWSVKTCLFHDEKPKIHFILAAFICILRRQCVNMIDTTWGRIYFLTCENFGREFRTP